MILYNICFGAIKLSLIALKMKWTISSIEFSSAAHKGYRSGQKGPNILTDSTWCKPNLCILFCLCWSSNCLSKGADYNLLVFVVKTLGTSTRLMDRITVLRK